MLWFGIFAQAPAFGRRFFSIKFLNRILHILVVVPQSRF